MSAKLVRGTAYSMVVGLSAALLSGCGGSSSHTVDTGTSGGLFGVDFIPADHALSIRTDTNPRIFWHAGYSPPDEFVVSLKKVNPDSRKDAVRTDLERVGDGYVWELQPTSDLDGSTLYFIEVEAAPESEVGMFLTEEVVQNRAAPSAGEPVRGQFEHRVVVSQSGPSDQ